jgi:hypothetical protein
MNPLNYGSLEASQRLHAKRIVLETEAVWIADEYPPFGASMKIVLKWDLRNKKELRGANFGKLPDGTIPAPSMAEVWRELPGGFTLIKGQIHGGATVTYGTKFNIYQMNPTDALIDLLIWITEQRKEEGE